LDDKEHARLRKGDLGAVKETLCPACYLWGCTGWKTRIGFGRLFLRSQHREPHQKGLTKGETYAVELIQRSPALLEPMELFLLNVLFDFVSTHGSLCAKNVLKPSPRGDKVPDRKENNRFILKNSDEYGKRSHVNYGLCKLALQPDGGPAANEAAPAVWEFVKTFRKRPGQYGEPDSVSAQWPDFSYVWYSKEWLDRNQINNMVKRNPQNPKEYQSVAGEDSIERWMGGEQQGNNNVSKKIFSFHPRDLIGLSDGRTWGYTKACPEGKQWVMSTFPFASSLRWGMDFLRERFLFDNIPSGG